MAGRGPGRNGARGGVTSGLQASTAPLDPREAPRTAVPNPEGTAQAVGPLLQVRLKQVWGEMGASNQAGRVPEEGLEASLEEDLARFRAENSPPTVVGWWWWGVLPREVARSRSIHS